MLRPGALPAASLAGPGPGGDCRHGQAGPSPAALNDRMNTEVTFGLRAGGTGGAEGRRAARAATQLRGGGPWARGLEAK